MGKNTRDEMKESGTGTSTTKYLANIDTDVSSKDLVDGSPLFNLSGDVIGIQLLSNTAKTFTPVSVLKKELIILTEVPKTQTP